MKNILLVFSLFLAAFACLPANAGLMNGAAKGIGKATKSVTGCVDRGVKGVGKGAKTTAGCAGKAVKTIL
jgi:hypothetical protein